MTKKLLWMTFCVGFAACAVEGEDELDEPLVLEGGGDDAEDDDGRASGSTRNYTFLSTEVGGFFAQASGPKAELEPGLAMDPDASAAPSGPLWAAYQAGAVNWMSAASTWWCGAHPPSAGQCDDLCDDIGMDYAGTFGPLNASVALPAWPTQQTVNVTVTKPIGLGSETAVCSTSSPCLYGPLALAIVEPKATCACNCE